MVVQVLPFTRSELGAMSTVTQSDWKQENKKGKCHLTILNGRELLFPLHCYLHLLQFISCSLFAVIVFFLL